MNIRLLAVLGAALFWALVRLYGADTQKIVDRETLSLRTHSTWEGSYAFSEENVLSIEGLPDLHVLIYKRSKAEGTLIDFTEATADHKLLLLREADTNVKGVTPRLEGIDVLPGTEEAEIIVRWRHPGQGGLRSVEKYRYIKGDLELVAGSEFVSDGRKMKWVKARPSTPSRPARFSPGPVKKPPAE